MHAYNPWNKSPTVAMQRAARQREASTHEKQHLATLGQLRRELREAGSWASGEKDPAALRCVLLVREGWGDVMAVSIDRATFGMRIRTLPDSVAEMLRAGCTMPDAVAIPPRIRDALDDGTVSLNWERDGERVVFRRFGYQSGNRDGGAQGTSTLRLPDLAPQFEEFGWREMLPDPATCPNEVQVDEELLASALKFMRPDGKKFKESLRSDDDRMICALQAIVKDCGGMATLHYGADEAGAILASADGNVLHVASPFKNVPWSRFSKWERTMREPVQLAA